MLSPPVGLTRGKFLRKLFKQLPLVSKIPRLVLTSNQGEAGTKVVRFHRLPRLLHLVECLAVCHLECLDRQCREGKMANTQLSPPDVNFVNSLRAVADQGGSGSQLNTVANYGSISALRGALNTANAGYYTVARLDQMTVNDMVFALRNMQDAKTIADYMSNSAA